MMNIYPNSQGGPQQQKKTEIAISVAATDEAEEALLPKDELEELLLLKIMILIRKAKTTRW